MDGWMYVFRVLLCVIQGVVCQVLQLDFTSSLEPCASHVRLSDESYILSCIDASWGFGCGGRKGGGP